MKKVSDIMTGFMQGDEFQSRMDNIRKAALSNKLVGQFLQEHNDFVNDEIIERDIGKLYEFHLGQTNCENCPGLDKCENLFTGFRPNLFINGKNIDLQYEACSLKKAADKRKEHERLIKSVYVPKDVLQARITEFYTDTPKRLLAKETAQEFLANYKPGSQKLGLYLHGKFGVGKSYLLGAIANALAEKEVASMIVYLPEFAREIKSSISDNTINEKLEAVKTVDVLMLDDIGAEATGEWFRDEILGAILQYRMTEQLPTFYTSNYNLDELENHLAEGRNGAEQKIKAARIMQRIRANVIAYELDGENRRSLEK